MTHARFRTPAMIIAAAALTAAPALAQYDDDRDDSQQRSSMGRSGQDQQGQNFRRDYDRTGFYDSDYMRMNRQPDQQVGGSRQDQQQRGATRFQNVRGTQGQAFGDDNWVRIAVDYNNDGNFDAYHLVNERELSQLRLAQARGGGAQADPWQQQSRFQQDRWYEAQQQQQRTRSDFDRDALERDDWSRSRWDQQDRFQQQQRWDDRPDQSDYYRSQSRSQTGMQGGQQTVRGQIESLNSVRLSGMRDEHILARVQTDDGRIQNVDLGPRNTLDDLDLNEGDQITLTGMQGRINQRPVLMATSIRSGGQTVNVQRNLQQGGMLDAGQMQRVNGSIVRTWRSTFTHDNEDHVLALVRLDSGESKLVDLGPQDRIDELDIGRGDEVSLIGKPTTIDGIQALCARTIEHEGEVININLPQNVMRVETEEGDTQQRLQRSGRVD